MWIFGFSLGVCSTEPRILVSSLEYLVSNGRQVLLGGVRLGGSATRPVDLRAGRHPVQREGARHQRRHPPRVICPDDTGPTKIVDLQEHDGIKDIAHPLLFLLERSPLPHLRCLFDEASSEVRQGGDSVVLHVEPLLLPPLVGP